MVSPAGSSALDADNNTSILVVNPLVKTTGPVMATTYPLAKKFQWLSVTGSMVPSIPLDTAILTSDGRESGERNTRDSMEGVMAVLRCPNSILIVEEKMERIRNVLFAKKYHDCRSTAKNLIRRRGMCSRIDEGWQTIVGSSVKWDMIDLGSILLYQPYRSMRVW